MTPSTLEIQTRAAQLVADGVAANLNDAIVRVVDSDPPLYGLALIEANELNRVSASASVPSTIPEAKVSFQGKARALVAAGQAETIDEAIGHICATDGSAYLEYLKSLPR